MLFVTKYTTAPATRDLGVERFKKTGGPPPAGVKMIGRWHMADGSGGIVICETDDATRLAAWVNDWTDVLVFDIRPVLTDEQMAKVLGA